jgi:XTP/dITP diphosphohydrolase
MTTELWIATGNPKKRGELDRLLRPLGVTLRLQSEAAGFVEVAEDQPDFAGNAAKKAVALARAVGAPAVADDSGLCVDALDGRPGVRSARYAGEGATDRDRVDKLLGELAATGAVDGAARGAHFVCSICLAGADGEVLARFEATCTGILRNAAKGDGGFGYDPIFVADQHRALDTTFAELTAEQKDAISHRGKALRSLRRWLEHHTLNQPPAPGTAHP